MRERDTGSKLLEIAPSSAGGFVKDILGFSAVLDKVILNQGVVCPEDFLRSGHRALRHDQKGPRKTKLKPRDRIALNKAKAVHPDAYEALSAIRRFGNVEAPNLPDVDDASTDSTISNDEIRSSDSDNDV